jgi:hypothetical protein
LLVPVFAISFYNSIQKLTNIETFCGFENEIAKTNLLALKKSHIDIGTGSGYNGTGNDVQS